MNHLDILRNKIIDRELLKKRAHMWKFQDHEVVFTNGCFDILHYGHIHTLAEARDMGDILVVGINTDASVQRLKGEGRPMMPQDERAMMLASLQFVDAVVLFSADTPLEVIKYLKPHVLVKGGDWKAEEIVGSEIVLAYGGQVKTTEYIAGLSTTNVIRKIKRS